MIRVSSSSAGPMIALTVSVAAFTTIWRSDGPRVRSQPLVAERRQTAPAAVDVAATRAERAAVGADGSFVAAGLGSVGRSVAEGQPAAVRRGALSSSEAIRQAPPSLPLFGRGAALCGSMRPRRAAPEIAKQVAAAGLKGPADAVSGLPTGDMIK